MNSAKFEYTTIYSEDTFVDYAYVLYKCRGKLRKVAIMLFAIFFGINGIFMIPTGSGDLLTAIIMLLLSLLLLLYLKHTPKRLAKAMIRNSKDFDEYRTITYTFYDTHFTVKDLDIETQVNYSKLYGIVATSKHVFLFTKPRVAYIIENEKIENQEELQQFLETRTNKQLTYLNH